MARRKINKIPVRLTLLAVALLLLLIFLFVLVPSKTSTAKQWNLTQRFAILSQAHTNLCAAPTFVGPMDNSSFIQGACCSFMNFTSYVEQVTGLRNYSSISLIPPDPYNISVSLAKTLLSYQNLTLSPAQQATFDSAMNMSSPCCCHCWRWYAFAGQAKYLIVHYNFSASRIATVWELEDGCGGPLNSAGFNPQATG